MTTALQLRRGTTSQHRTFTGANGEVTVDTTKKTAVVHDGVTPGGTPLAKEADALNKVRFDVSTQGLKDTQKSNARTNINAAKDPGTNGWIVRTGAGTTAARSLVAGSGISISNVDGTAGNPTISNSGVLSVNGQTGNVTVAVDTSDRVAKAGDTMTGSLVSQSGLQTAKATDPVVEVHKPGVIAGALMITSDNRLSLVQSNGSGAWVASRFQVDLDSAGYGYINGNVIATKVDSTLTKTNDTIGLTSGIIAAGWQGWSSTTRNGAYNNVAGIYVDTYGRVTSVVTNCNCTCC